VEETFGQAETNIYSNKMENYIRRSCDVECRADEVRGDCEVISKLAALAPVE
jgi:hypothetical protein